MRAMSRFLTLIVAGIAMAWCSGYGADRPLPRSVLPPVPAVVFFEADLTGAGGGQEGLQSAVVQAAVNHLSYAALARGFEVDIKVTKESKDSRGEVVNLFFRGSNECDRYGLVVFSSEIELKKQTGSGCNSSTLGSM